ncbi:MAG: protein-export chaperone SecB [Gammaproteobacteria bacterium]|nr:MAG: protein-export chaperone SecB [Gammaproteobacteria bacterium]
MAEENNPAPAGKEPELAIIRIYLKDVSFETPNSPAVFTQEFNPATKIQVNTAVNALDENIYEVVLTITVTADHQDTIFFLVEVQQAGIFNIKGYDDTQRGSLLRAYCLNTLFPYAREAISDLVVKGGFPSLVLAPINFDGQQPEETSKTNTQPVTPE